MKEISSFDALDKLRADLLRLPSVTARIAELGAVKFSELAAADFAAHRSPYGEAWGTGETGKPLDLEESGRLRGNAIKYVANGRTIRASVAAIPYSKYQLKRGILPARGRLPVAWGAALKKIADDELKKHMGGS